MQTLMQKQRSICSVKTLGSKTWIKSGVACNYYYRCTLNILWQKCARFRTVFWESNPEAKHTRYRQKLMYERIAQGLRCVKKLHLYIRASWLGPQTRTLFLKPNEKEGNRSARRKTLLTGNLEFMNFRLPSP